MRSIAFVILALAAGIAGAGQANAQSIQITFSELQSVIPSEDAGVCKARYGDGYVTSPHSNGAAHHKVSDSGHTIHIKKSTLSMHHGVYVMSNEYDVMFKDADVEKTEAFVYATALSGRTEFSGVFSDGRCKGKVTIGPK